MTEKEALRARMRRARAAIDPAQRRVLEGRIEARLLGLPEVARARSLLLFYAIGTEVGTSVLARRLHERGIPLLLPYLDAGEMRAAVVAPGDEMVPSTHGPREPAARAGDARADVVIAPGLAFDRRGGRLGYGGGHYDRFLEGNRDALAIGAGFSVQVVDEVPMTAHDVTLDLVVTDQEVIDCAAERGEPPARSL